MRVDDIHPCPRILTHITPSVLDHESVVSCEGYFANQLNLTKNVVQRVVHHSDVVGKVVHAIYNTAEERSYGLELHDAGLETVACGFEGLDGLH